MTADFRRAGEYCSLEEVSTRLRYLSIWMCSGSIPQQPPISRAPISSHHWASTAKSSGRSCLYTSQTQRFPEFRFSATVGQEPEIELALV